jgi:hypothetical protein
VGVAADGVGVGDGSRAVGVGEVSVSVGGTAVGDGVGIAVGVGIGRAVAGIVAGFVGSASVVTRDTTLGCGCVAKVVCRSAIELHDTPTHASSAKAQQMMATGFPCFVAGLSGRHFLRIWAVS